MSDDDVIIGCVCCFIVLIPVVIITILFVSGQPIGFLDWVIYDPEGGQSIPGYEPLIFIGGISVIIFSTIFSLKKKIRQKK